MKALAGLTCILSVLLLSQPAPAADINFFTPPSEPADQTDTVRSAAESWFSGSTPRPWIVASWPLKSNQQFESNGVRFADRFFFGVQFGSDNSGPSELCPYCALVEPTRRTFLNARAGLENKSSWFMAL